MMGAVYAGLALRHPLRADAAVRAGYSEHYATRQQVSNLLAIGTVVIREIADLPIPRMLDELTVPALRCGARTTSSPPPRPRAG